MNRQPVDFLDPVKGDIENAINYYNTWRSDGSRHFKKLLSDAIDWIEWNPELFSLKYRHFRRAILRKSYYAVYYAIEQDVTVVVAVLDMRQNPKNIRALIGQRWINR